MNQFLGKSFESTLQTKIYFEEVLGQKYFDISEISKNLISILVWKK